MRSIVVGRALCNDENVADFNSQNISNSMGKGKGEGKVRERLPGKIPGKVREGRVREG